MLRLVGSIVIGMHQKALWTNSLLSFVQVLPPLCAELRNLVMQPMILPMVLTIAESQVLFICIHAFEFNNLQIYMI